MIAVNPFKNVEIYGNDVISAYQKKVMDAPHVYAVADAAYDEMMRGEEMHLYSRFSYFHDLGSPNRSSSEYLHLHVEPFYMQKRRISLL